MVTCLSFLSAADQKVLLLVTHALSGHELLYQMFSIVFDIVICSINIERYFHGIHAVHKTKRTRN